MKWNKQEPPVSEEALKLIGYTVTAHNNVHKVDDTDMQRVIGSFNDVKWATTTNGPGLMFEGKLLGVLPRVKDGDLFLSVPHRGPHPGALVNVPEEPPKSKTAPQPEPLPTTGKKCPWCREHNAVVEETRLHRQAPVFKFVRCPDCGARGPSFWEMDAAIEAWRQMDKIVTQWEAYRYLPEEAAATGPGTTDSAPTIKP